jgi:hypothetical protein
MSHSFRPVKEIWNMHSSCFVDEDRYSTLVPRGKLANRLPSSLPIAQR